MADDNRPKGRKTDAEIADILDVSLSTISLLEKRFITYGIDAAIYDKPRAGRPVKFTASDRAKVTAIACSNPPSGYGKWSLRLMADRLVELDLVETISYQTVKGRFKKTNFPHT